ncbi:oxidoreductase [Methylobacterium durans]|uniref:oxidoreductase n=1 Tax=Methylobacterium durans TaxID=2202825 RepID=UPI002AFFD684|nr:oxidoreductase [Methylobacterium durans]MEA1833170.1 oxidoreductase [Methylobacterium durans]
MTKSRWSDADIPPQAGRLAIVTGATSGLGYEAARALAGAGARVVLAARDADKAARAMVSIRHVHPEARLDFRPLDTASLASVRAFADGWQAEAKPVDALLLNAGIASVPRREETADGFERQLGTNYLGHFALAGLLLPHLRPGPATRVVAVASIAHRSGRIHFDDLQLRHGYAPQVAYRQTKLALLMVALELDRRLRTAGSAVRALAAHPGLARTDITRRGDRAGPLARLAGRVIFGAIGQSAARGAGPILYAATAPEAEGGAYYGPDGFREFWGDPAVADVAPHARDADAARRLWALSEVLTGVRVPLPGAPAAPLG